MRKFILSAVLTLATILPASALPPGIFDHVGVGLGVGLSGISVEAATPITRFVQLRAGVSIMPAIKFGVDTEADYTYYVNGEPASGTTDIRLHGNLSRVQGQVIFNVYPIPMASLYVAAGAYFGGSKMVGIKGYSPELEEYKGSQVQVGDYTLPVDDKGYVNGGIKVNGFRPYLGLGWGRAVPGKLFNFQVELGVQFHGKPELFTEFGEIDYPDEVDDDTFQKIMDKVKVYPNLMFRLNFRAF